MTKTVLQKFRPLFVICAGICFATFMLVVVSCVIVYESIVRHSSGNFAWIFPALLLVLHMFIVFFSICKWNCYVFLYEDAITQYQWGKEVIILYDEIKDVKISHLSPIYPPTMTLFDNENKISFELTKLDIFLSYCTNLKVIDKINALQRQ